MSGESRALRKSDGTARFPRSAYHSAYHFHLVRQLTGTVPHWGERLPLRFPTAPARAGMILQRKVAFGVPVGPSEDIDIAPGVG